MAQPTLANGNAEGIARQWFPVKRVWRMACLCELRSEQMSGRIASLILALVLLTGQQPVRSQSKASADGFDLVDKTGNIRKPSDVRDLYQLLGTYTVELDPKGEEMHVTYASPDAAPDYRKNGKCADGRVLVKEVLGT